jgi:nucleotide-binding universal stress UspA family protein
VSVLVVIEVPAALPLDAHMPEEEAEAREILAVAEAIGDERGVRIDWRVARARVAGEVIVDAARELDAEPIVLQAGGRRRPLLHTSGQYVLAHAGCRVLLCAPAS